MPVCPFCNGSGVDIDKTEEEDWKHSALPEELEILSVLPEAEQSFVFELAGRQTHCQNLGEWLRYLKQYVAGYVTARP